MKYTSSNGEILRNIFTNFSIKGDTFTETILKDLINKQLCKSVQLTDVGENLRNKKAKKNISVLKKCIDIYRLCFLKHYMYLR